MRFKGLPGWFASILVLTLLVGYAIAPGDGSAQDQQAEIQLFREEAFQGDSIAISSSLFDMPPGLDEVRGWNDTVRSLIVVKGTWRLYQHGRYNTDLADAAITGPSISPRRSVFGWSCLVSGGPNGPIRYSSPAVGGFNSDISSIELVSQENLPEWALFPDAQAAPKENGE